ncbi:hypothetical protein [Lacrimispora celerecrescens]|uniref:Uncharacterized protein n=1 Tax=[Clostridium] celerecrescens 18A TaxID=1286362 RepID=A0A2M8Z2X3_9FIRM|nr:hypothetical protein [Lacrimispora celerecrescens]PJJ27807.1 hypothetical protein H171_1286 [[Clostridium] celerecrescens 18A]
MKNIIRLPLITILLITIFSFNAFAMNNEYIAPERQTPLNEKRNEDRSLDFRWTWISDDSCVRFRTNENVNKARIDKMYELGALPQWAEDGKDGYGVVKKRYTYSGKWVQAADGIWSFLFDDYTIPVGVTLIDGVLYAFNTYGELKADYEYYDGLKTKADGLVKADSAEFTQWLTTQYLPECTSHE